MFDLASTLAPMPQSDSRSKLDSWTWSSPIQFDPNLIDHLVDELRQLAATLAELSSAARSGMADAAADAIQNCMDRMQNLHRLEALKLYPLIARVMAHDVEGNDILTQWRVEINGLGRRFLRLVEGLLEAVKIGEIPVADLVLTEAVLRRYIARKESEIYPLYQCAGL